MTRTKKRTVILFLLLMLFFAVAVLLFSGRGKANSKNEYPVTRVSVILPHRDDGYWSLIAEGIAEAEEELGDLYNIDIRTLIPKLNYNIAQMTDLLRQQTAAKVDVIVVQGNENPQFREALEAAHEEGIQVICLDTDMEKFPYELYIGTDNYEAGRLLGEQLIVLTGGKAVVGVVSGASGYPNLDQRLAGLEDAVANMPQIQLLPVNYDNYDGLTFMRLYNELSEEADVLVCLEGTGGVTLESVHTDHGSEYRYILGFDAYEGVKRRVLDGIVKQDTNQMGRKVVEEIAGYIQKGSYSTDTIYTDIHWLTADNYSEVMG